MKRYQEYLDKVYINHVKEGYEDRARLIEQQMAEHNIQFSYVLDYDIPDLIEEDLLNYFVNSETLRKSSLSNSRKHFSINEDIVRNNYKLCLVFEDDVILSKKFNKIMNIITPEVYSMKGPVIVSLGNGANMYVNRWNYKKEKYLYKENKNRCADSFLINRLAAKNRMDWFKNNRAFLPLDHMYNKIDADMGNEIYWLAPTIVEQGSQNGKLPSTAAGRNKKFHRLRWIWKDFRRRIRGI